MKVLLSGTSNSILANGLSTALARDPQIETFTNASYGASGTVAIGDHLQRIDFTKHDVCIIDYCVNEEVFVHLGVTTPESAVSNICNLVDAASRAGCLPVIAILPTYQRIGLGRPLEEALIRAFAPYGVPIFNVYDYIEPFAQRHDFELRDLFLNPNHIQRELGYFVGLEITRFLSEADLQTVALRETATDYQPLTFIPHDQLRVRGESRLLERSSRLMTRCFLNISPGSEVQLEHEGPCILSGISLNASRSSGRLTEQETRTEIFSYEHKTQFTLKRELTQVSLPLQPAMTLETGSATLNYLANDPDGTDHPESQLELSGFIVTAPDPARRCAALGLQGDGARIERLIEPAREVAVAQSLASTIAQQKAAAQ